MATPSRLVQLAFEADRVLTYEPRQASPLSTRDAPQNSARRADEHEHRAYAGRFAWAQGPVKSKQSNRP